jgi:hypothetical protein
LLSGVLVENVATPDPLRAIAANWVVPSKKVTVPVGVTVAAPWFTVAVRVTLAPGAICGELGDKVVVSSLTPTVAVSQTPRPCVAMRSVRFAVIFMSKTATLGKPAP